MPKNEQKLASKLTHFSEKGDAHMVDVGHKMVTERVALAEGIIEMAADTLAHLQAGRTHKGDVFGVARLAGIMAAKKTADLIPLCHPLPLSHVAIEFEILAEGVRCLATAKTSGQTGVEMEALCAVQVTLLTLYDMLKAVDRSMTMSSIRLLEKSGGRSGHWRRADSTR